MSESKTIRTCVALGLAIGLTPALANAADWQAGTINYNGETADYVAFQDEAGPTVSILCVEQPSLQTAVYLDGGEPTDITIGKRSNTVDRKVTMDSSSTDSREGVWTYLRTSKLLTTTRGWQGRRIFNSAVKGEAVNMDIRFMDDVAFTPPPMNEAFKEFAKSCEVLNPAE